MGAGIAAASGSTARLRNVILIFCGFAPTEIVSVGLREKRNGSGEGERINLEGETCFGGMHCRNTS